MEERFHIDTPSILIQPKYEVEDHITNKLYERLGFPVSITKEKLERLHLQELEQRKLQMDRYLRGIEQTKIDQKLARIEQAKEHNQRLQELLQQREDEEKEYEEMKKLAQSIKDDLAKLTDPSTLMRRKRRKRKKRKYVQIEEGIKEEDNEEDS